LHGNGFLNSGILTDPRTAGPHSFTVRFTQPGTYRLDCLIHEGMQAVITVRARTQHPAEQANGAARAAAALGPGLAATPLARRPYDLRHAALSLWLAAGAPPAEIRPRRA
jgi:hypothetical protein